MELYVPPNMCTIDLPLYRKQFVMDAKVRRCGDRKYSLMRMFIQMAHDRERWKANTLMGPPLKSKRKDKHII